MASEGVSANTLLIVGAAAVLFWMYNKRQDEARRRLDAAKAKAAAEGRTFGMTRDEIDLIRAAAGGIGWLIGQFGSDDNVSGGSSLGSGGADLDGSGTGGDLWAGSDYDTESSGFDDGSWLDEPGNENQDVDLGNGEWAYA